MPAPARVTRDAGARIARTAGNRAFAVLARDPDGWSGPSYARHGPAGSVVEDRRAGVGSGHGLGEAERDLIAKSADSAGKVGDAIVKLLAIKDDLDRRSREHKSWLGDPDERYVDTASRVQGLVEALTKLKAGLQGLAAESGKNGGLSFGDEPSPGDRQVAVVQNVGALINGLALASDAIAASDKLDDFQKTPSQQTAEAWANSVTSTFDDLGKIVGFFGDKTLPPGLSWIGDYFQGLLSAPKAYVGAFIGFMHARYGKIDYEIGRFQDFTHFMGNPNENDGWGGPLTDLVLKAFFDRRELYNWLMLQKQGDKSIMRRSAKDAIDILSSQIMGSVTLSEDVKTDWVNWLRAHTPA
jgi:hypothetical protein